MGSPTVAPVAPNGDLFSPDEIASAGGANASPPPTATPTAPNGALFSPDEIAAAGGNGPAADSGIQRDADGTVHIVPKPGESFGDTMKRAAAYGQTVTPAQISSQVAKGVSDLPAVGAGVVGAGIGLPAALAGAGEVTTAAKNYVLNQLAAQTPQLFGHEAAKETLKRYALEGLQKATTGATWAAGAEVLHSVWDDLFKSKK